MTLQIEAGKFYRDRSGEKIGPMAPNPDSNDYPWTCAYGLTYRDSGAYLGDNADESIDVVVAEWVDDDIAATTFGPLDNYLETMPVDACGQSVTGGHNYVMGGVHHLDTIPEQPQGSADLVQPDVKMLRATEIATKAAELVGGDRDRQHGAKRDNFGRIAEMWNAWLRIRRDPVAPLDAHDVGVMMTFMKMARTQSGNLNLDDYVDAAGYASCAGEVAQAA